MAQKKKTSIQNDFVDFLMGKDKSSDKPKDVELSESSEVLEVENAKTRLSKSISPDEGTFVFEESSGKDRDLEEPQESSKKDRNVEESTENTNIIDIKSEDSKETIATKQEQSTTIERSELATVITKTHSKFQEDGEATIVTKAKDVPSASVEKVLEWDFPQTANQSALTLKQAESLKIAQERVLELEQEVDDLREVNEELRAAGEVMHIKTEEQQSNIEKLEVKRKDIAEKMNDNLQVSQAKVSAKNKALQQLNIQVEALELRLKKDLQSIRVRERELENRLELVRLENQALLRSKDELILDLKRQFDQSKMELAKFKEKGRELNAQLDESDEKMRRTVKALRLALSMLDDDDDISSVSEDYSEAAVSEENTSYSNDDDEKKSG